jgi:integrase
MRFPPSVPETSTFPLSVELFDAIAIILSTGLRLGELTVLRWSDVDLSRGVLKLEGKSGRRELPLCRPVVDLLRARKKNLMVFPPATGRRLRHTMHRLGCPPILLRRFAASILRGDGLSVDDIVSGLGYRTAKTTRRLYRELASKGVPGTAKPTGKSRQLPKQPLSRKRS